MLMFAAACSHVDPQPMLTLVGGGSATVTLSHVEGSADSSFEVQGLTQDELDDLFRDVETANDAWGRLNTHTLFEDTFQRVWIEHDDRNGVTDVAVAANGLVGFEPCTLALAHGELLVSLTEPSFIDVWFDTGTTPADGETNLVVASAKDVEEWSVDEYEGVVSIEVEIACPSGPMTGLLELEWALDPTVTRSAKFLPPDDYDFTWD